MTQLLENRGPGDRTRHLHDTPGLIQSRTSIVDRKPEFQHRYRMLKPTLLGTIGPFQTPYPYPASRVNRIVHDFNSPSNPPSSLLLYALSNKEYHSLCTLEPETEAPILTPPPKPPPAPPQPSRHSITPTRLSSSSQGPPPPRQTTPQRAARFPVRLDLLGAPAGISFPHIGRGLDGGDEFEDDVGDTDEADNGAGDDAEDAVVEEDASDKDVDYPSITTWLRLTLDWT